MLSEEEFLDGYIERGEEVFEYCEDVRYSMGFYWGGVR